MCSMNPDYLTSGQRLMAESRHMGVEVKVAADKLDRLEAENAKLRELCKSMRCALVDSDDKVYLDALDDTLIGAGFDLQELGIEATVK